MIIGDLSSPLMTAPPHDLRPQIKLLDLGEIESFLSKVQTTDDL
jgi:hypothetical protein